MTLTLNLGDLGSRAARIASAGNSGIRRIATQATTRGADEENGLISVYNAINKFGSGLMRGTLQAFANLFTFSWSKLWGMLVGGFQFLINFNWNATDAQLDGQIKQAEIGLAAARGRLAGQSLGYAICGLVPTATIAVFNEPMALYILKELGEEAAEEISASLANLITLQFKQQARSAFVNLYKNYRSLFRTGVEGIAQTLVDVGVLTQDTVANMFIKRNEPWSFASALSDSIESIADPAEQAYAEEFWDELQDSCIDAGYIVAGGIDGYMAQQRISNLSVFGRERIIEITPNRAIDSTPGMITP